jgi:glucosamine-6-phosphate deaminase
MVDLHPITIVDAVKDFGSESQVIRRALTLGIGTILAARAVLILAFGAGKVEAVAQALLGPMFPACPASLLQSIPGKVTWMIDEAAAGGLA